MSSEIFAGLELLINLINRLAAASAVVSQARAEGRDVTPEELTRLRDEGDAALSDLNTAIARAKEEGR